MDSTQNVAASIMVWLASQDRFIFGKVFSIRPQSGKMPQLMIPFSYHNFHVSWDDIAKRR